MEPSTKERPGAFFDVDYTILANNSATLFVKYLRRQGKVGFGAILNTLYYVVRYKLNLLDFHGLAEKETMKLLGTAEAEMIEMCNRWFEEMVVHYIYPEARALIKEHQRAGDPVILLSAATIYLVRPLAEYLGVEHYLCNRLEVDAEGIFTGRLIRPLCYGDGKIILAEEFATAHGLALSASWYYTDSITDLPVLLRYGKPIAVNPDPLLRKEAKRRSWAIRDFKRLEA